MPAWLAGSERGDRDFSREISRGETGAARTRAQIRRDGPRAAWRTTSRDRRTSSRRLRWRSADQTPSTPAEQSPHLAQGISRYRRSGRRSDPPVRWNCRACRGALELSRGARAHPRWKAPRQLLCQLSRCAAADAARVGRRFHSTNPRLSTVTAAWAADLQTNAPEVRCLPSAGFLRLLRTGNGPSVNLKHRSGIRNCCRMRYRRTQCPGTMRQPPP